MEWGHERGTQTDRQTEQTEGPGDRENEMGGGTQERVLLKGSSVA